MAITAAGINAEAAYNSGSAGQPSGWWHERKVVIEKLKPQIIRTGAKDKGTLDQFAAMGATIWPVFTEDAAGILKWLKAYWTHKAQSRGVSRGNEPWFYSTPVQGDAWARQCKPIYEALRNDPDIGKLLHLSVPIIPTHSKTPNFFAKFIAAWPDFVNVVDSIDLHPYSNKVDPMSSSSPGLKWHFEFCRNLLDTHGGKHILFVATEFGWADHGSGGNAYDVVPTQTQADWEDKSFNYMISRGDVCAAFPYMTCDSYNGNDNENEQRHFGHYFDPPPGGSALTPKAVAAKYVAQRDKQVKAGAPNVFSRAGSTTPPPGGGNGGTVPPAGQLVVSADPNHPDTVLFQYDPKVITKIKVYQQDIETFPAPAGSYQYNTIDPAVDHWVASRLSDAHPNVWVDGIGIDANGKEVGKWYSDTLPEKKLVHVTKSPVRKTPAQLLFEMIPDLKAAVTKVTGQPATVIVENVPNPDTIHIGSDDYVFGVAVDDLRN